MRWNEETALEILKEAIREALGFHYSCLPQQVDRALMASMSNYVGSSHAPHAIPSDLDPIQITFH